MRNAKLGAHQGELKAQVGSLTSQIDANQEEMKAMLDACLERWRQRGELKFIAMHGGSLRNMPQWKLVAR
jgi:peptidoglycan/xylan/chitin deacetylase (PgdA/CDA1 family)